MLYQIKIFRIVYEERSFSHAAKRLGLTQSAISQQIKTLEDELGAPLFDPADRRRPTEEGNFLYREGGRLIAAVDDLKSGIINLKGLMKGKIKFGMIDVAAIGLLPKVLKLFRHEYPDIEMEAEVRPSGELVKKVQNHELDFCVGVVNQIPNDIEHKTFYRDSIVAVVSGKSQLSSKKRIEIKELKGEPLILYPVGSYSRGIVEEVMHQNDIVPTVAMEMHYPAAIISLVAQGMGVGLLSELSVKEERLHGQKVLIISQLEKKREIGIMYRKDRLLSPPSKALMGMILKTDG